MTAPAAAAWEALLATALVGTERRAAPPAVLDLPLDAVEPAEARVLAAAAVLTARRRAGAVPHHDVEPLPIAPLDTRAPAGIGATQVLALLLGADVPVLGSSEIVHEWLVTAAQHDVRVPHAVLVALLDLATRDRTLREPLRAVLDARGTWLAARRAEWRWATGIAAAARELDHEWWTTATRSDRLAALRAVRERDPDAARELLVATWASESAGERAELLAPLAVGIGPADEPFLEAALDDRSKLVRAAAVPLLDALPTSRRAARMAARVTPLVGVAGRGRNRALEFANPPRPDDAGRRDGIGDNKPAGVTQREWWLVQMVGGAPLAIWPSHLGVTRDEVARLAAEDDAFFEGLQRAALAQRDPEWITALFAYHPSAELLAGLDAATASAALLGAIDALDDQALALRLRRTAGPWSDALSAALVTRWRQAGDKLLAWAVPEEGATRLAASTSDAVDAWRGALSPTTQLAVRVASLHHALTLRRTIHDQMEPDR